MKQSNGYRLAIFTIISLLAVCLDVVLSPQLGFLSVGAMPYLALVVAVAAVSGGGAAVLIAVLILGVVTLVAPLTGELLNIPVARINPAALTGEQRVGLVLGIAVTAAIVYNRSTLTAGVQQATAGAREAREEADTMRREAAAMETSLRDLYTRHAVEHRSISGLGEQLSRFQSLDRATVLDATLSSTRLMTGASGVVIYQLDEGTLQLTRRAVWPEPDRDRYASTLDIASTIEGWVVRTNQMFTLRYLTEQPELAEIDHGNTIIAVPIRTRGRTWGVLVVGDMPFLAYNQTAEVSLEVVAALAAGGVEQSFGSAGMVAHTTTGSDSAAVSPAGASARTPAGGPGGGPASGESLVLHDMDSLYRDLETMADAGGQVSLFIVELRGYARQPLTLSHDRQRQLVETVCDRLYLLTSGAARFYRYQLANQFALVGANLGYDAAPYFLLRILETIGGQAWSVDAETVLPEPLVGFSSSNDGDPEVMVDRAEAMLA
ncbi:MAG: GAF domain-containing protein, partial [Alkalispirochaeta sp.]